MLISDATPTLYDVVELYGETLDDTLNTYPIWDEAERAWLNECIYTHFCYREIAQDTPALFKFYLRRKMLEIMPTINPLFKAFADVDIMAQWSSDTATTGTTGSGTTSDTTSYSFPQNELDDAGESYATALARVNAETGGTNEDSTHSEGRNSSVAALATEWTNGVNNALLLLYNALEPLFIQVWD